MFSPELLFSGAVIGSCCQPSANAERRGLTGQLAKSLTCFLDSLAPAIAVFVHMHTLNCKNQSTFQKIDLDQRSRSHKKLKWYKVEENLFNNIFHLDF